MSPILSLSVTPNERRRIQHTDITALIYTKDRTEAQTLKLRRQVQDLALECGVFSGFVKASSIVVLLEYDTTLVGYLLLQDNADLSFALLPKYAKNTYLQYGFVTSCLRMIGKDRVYWNRNVCTITSHMFGTQITTQTGDDPAIISDYMISYKTFNEIWELVAKPKQKLLITSEYRSPCSDEKIVSLYELGSGEKYPIFTHTGVTSQDHTLVITDIELLFDDKNEAIVAYCDHVLTLNPDVFISYEHDIFVRMSDGLWRLSTTKTYHYDTATIDAYKARLYRVVRAADAAVKETIDG